MTKSGGQRTNLLQWGCLSLLLGSITLVIVTGAWLFTKPAEPPPGPYPTALILTATPTPTAMPTPVPTATPIFATPVPPEGVSVGIRVQVTGTGEVGLSIRAVPSQSGERIAVASEGESFLVVGGPTEADELTWWLLRDETNPQREGWAAANYLVPRP